MNETKKPTAAEKLEQARAAARKAAADAHLERRRQGPKRGEVYALHSRDCEQVVALEESAALLKRKRSAGSAFAVGQVLEVPWGRATVLEMRGKDMVIGTAPPHGVEEFPAEGTQFRVRKRLDGGGALVRPARGRLVAQ